MPDLDVTETYVQYALEADNMSFYINHWNSENDRLTSYSVKEHSTMYSDIPYKFKAFLQYN